MPDESSPFKPPNDTFYKEVIGIVQIPSECIGNAFGSCNTMISLILSATTSQDSAIVKARLLVSIAGNNLRDSCMNEKRGKASRPYWAHLLEFILGRQGLLTLVYMLHKPDEEISYSTQRILTFTSSYQVN